MTPLSGLFFALAALLVVAGCFKLLTPGPTSATLRDLGVRAGPLGVRSIGLAEVVVGIWALASGSRPAALALGATYLLFARVTVLAQRGSSSSCGCFGRAESPPSRIHLTVDLAGAALALGAAWSPVGSLSSVLAAQPWAGVPFLVWTGLAVYLLYLVLTLLPRTLAAAATRPSAPVSAGS